MRWTKQQGGFTGYPHSGSGMQVTPAVAAKRMIDLLDANKDGRLTRAEIGDAHQLLAPLLGTGLASTLFAVALLASGQNATLTGTLAGQIVMEGFLDLRIAAWARRLITRMIAIGPAAGVTIFYGSEGTGMLLILSQVVLALPPVDSRRVRVIVRRPLSFTNRTYNFGEPKVVIRFRDVDEENA